MSDACVSADKFNQKLTKKFGFGMILDEHVDGRFQEITAMAEAADAAYVQKHIVSFVGEYAGQRTVSAAEILFVRFGQGDDAAWVAHAVFEGGWANSYRPLTPNTATMAWLDAYVTKELVG